MGLSSKTHAQWTKLDVEFLKFLQISALCKIRYIICWISLLVFYVVGIDQPRYRLKSNQSMTRPTSMTFQKSTLLGVSVLFFHFVIQAYSSGCDPYLINQILRLGLAYNMIATLKKFKSQVAFEFPSSAAN